MTPNIEYGLVYGRASRDPRHTGTSVDKQLERGTKWGISEGIRLLDPIRDDNSSASRGSRERPGFQEVRRLIEQRKINVLILWEVSRSSRDAEESMALLNAAEDAGVVIAVDGRRYDPADDADRLQLQFLFILAEQEARKIKKRNTDSVLTNAERRTPHGRIPYGFLRVYDPKTGVLLGQTPYVKTDVSGEMLRDAEGQPIGELDPETERRTLSAEARVILESTQAVLNGVTLRRICRDLDAAGVPSPRKPNKKTLAENPNGVVVTWNPQSLRQLLLNPTNAGRRVHQGTDIGQAAWQPIVDYGTWLKLKALLTDPSRLSVAKPRGPEPRHLLSNIAKCGECGARMKGATNLTRMPRAYACRHEGCMKVIVTAPSTDDVVEGAVLGLFAMPGFRAALAAAQQRRTAEQERGPDVTELIAAKEAELDEVEALRTAGDMTMRAYAAETKRIEEAIEELRGQEVAHVTSLALRRMMAAETLEEGWKVASLIDQREVLRLLFEITIKKAVVRGRRFDTTRVVVDPSAFLADDILRGEGLTTDQAG